MLLDTSTRALALDLVLWLVFTFLGGVGVALVTMNPAFGIAAAGLLGGVLFVLIPGPRLRSSEPRPAPRRPQRWSELN